MPAKFIYKNVRAERSTSSLWTRAPPGHLCAGEGYDDAAQRELQEELGINVPLEKSLAPRLGTHRARFHLPLRGLLLSDPKPNRSEIEAGVFCSAAIVGRLDRSADRSISRPGFVECWGAYRRKKRA